MKKILFISLSIIICSVKLMAQQTGSTIHSTIFGTDRTVKVALPAEYNDNPTRKYMVAYLTDAQSQPFFDYILATINYLTNSGFMQPVILVGIVSPQRQFEYTPVANTQEGKKSFYKSGGADSLALSLRQEVIPFIQKNYRCTGYNTGIGHSLGGTFVTFCLLKYPDLFQSTIAISPNLHYDQQQVVAQLALLRNTSALSKHLLYMAYGYGDDYEEKFKPATQKFDSILKQKNIPGLGWKVVALDNDSHGATAGEGIYKGLICLYRHFLLPYEKLQVMFKDQQTDLTVNVKKYYAARADSFGITLPFVNELNDIGYNCFYEKRTKDAINIFTWALSLYPKDINLYDSMGEMQQEAGDKKQALYYYQLGLENVRSQEKLLTKEHYEDLVKGFSSRIASVK